MGQIQDRGNARGQMVGNDTLKPISGEWFNSNKQSSTMTKLSAAILAILCVIATSCADHDDPELSPIDTTKVKISAKVEATPTSSWLSTAEEITVCVSDVAMSAPKGVVLRNINLYKNGQRILSKPYSGEALEFKVPLNHASGRIYLSVIGDLIQKNCRDAEIIIADNIQRVVFTNVPKLEYKAQLNVTAKSLSTSGEEYSQCFDVESRDGYIISIPQDKLYWTPTSGTASTIELTLKGSADTWSSNSTLESEVTGIRWNTYKPDSPDLNISIPNKPGSLNQLQLRMDVNARFFGTTENITIEPQNISLSFLVGE